MQDTSKEKIAKAYAKSYLEVASSTSMEDSIILEVKALEESINNSKDLWDKLFSLKTEDTKTKDIITSFAKKLKLAKATTNLLLLLSANSKLSLLPTVLEKYKEFYYEQKKIIGINVETVIPLTSAQDKKLKKVLTEKLKKQVELTYIINKEILGGLRISFGSYQIDDTLKSKLDAIQKTLKG